MSQKQVISYPIPPYQNVPIAPQNFQPSQFFISAITLGYTTLVTTSVNHNYVIGQLVRLLIPQGYGSTQLNEKLGYVIAIPSTTQVTLDLNSSQANPFVNIGTNTKAQIVAVGDINNGSTNSNGRNSEPLYPPGTFINISA